MQHTSVAGYKTCNVIDKLPKRTQGTAKGLQKDIYAAGTKRDAKSALDHFCDVFEAKHPKAV